MNAYDSQMAAPRPAAYGEAAMSLPGTLSAALAYLPLWWQEGGELEATLAG